MTLLLLLVLVASTRADEMTTTTSAYNESAADGEMKKRRDGVDVGIVITNAPLNAALPSDLVFWINGTNATVLVGGGGVTQTADAFGVVMQNTTSRVAERTTTIRVSCPPGFFTLSGGGECALCPWGFWCNASYAYACPMGTANGASGASSPDTACTPCAPGTYTSAPGAPACLACPVGQYCAGGANVPQACPRHTTSAAGGISLLDCVCLPDYLCTYTRRVTLQLALNTSLTLQTLQSDPSVATTLREGVLLALDLYGVPGVSATLVDLA